MLEKLTEKFSDLSRQLSGQAKISDKNIEDAVNEIKLALLDADVNVRVVRRFVNSTIEEARGEKVLKAVDPSQMFIKLVYDRMVSLLGDSKQDLELKGPDTVSSILFLGLNGAGKTTTAAKLASRLKSEGRRPLLVACDLARPAAVQQLKVLGEQIGVEVYAEDAKNPVKVAKNALKHAKKFQFNTVIFDTAGRLQIDADLMKQIREIKDAVKPDETILVADAMTGQSAVDIAKTFDEELDLTGVILSKFDSDTRGGAALSLKSITGKAIKYIGVGEKIENLEPFYPERIASRILGMGDIVSLVEKAQETASEEEALELQKKMASATFNLEDYLDQFQRMRKMGSVQSLVGMLPGLAGKVNEDDIDEAALKREEAIILSMTFKERRNHRIIGPPRKRRIALGSGSTVADVNRLIKNFEKMRLMMKKISKNKKYQAQLMQQFGGMS
ncbi:MULTISPECIES: signal recognition particle protein [unclassified Oceanispirochaeta]|uniref:signal recognition particle protein n=1 Tax=unclassified Oceanispirochaeta TaxID=2635722 RepID=UPI000E091DB2|nr:MULTISPECIES: signal recognition particle protein [unclassified Oceanispirochaeta]MBF9017636.1 signal recognition particle protein [Oceanispirochaeta sp. M2]NPD74208.1 signal recognition particle protein [Oceanispirochaeta sp. M1]RDG29914.1 signal recognition particle protein [Oceanispirochaeta sp. M1]